jgi:hypothetical protein
MHNKEYKLQNISQKSYPWTDGSTDDVSQTTHPWSDRMGTRDSNPPYNIRPTVPRTHHTNNSRGNLKEEFYNMESCFSFSLFLFPYFQLPDSCELLKYLTWGCHFIITDKTRSKGEEDRRCRCYERQRAQCVEIEVSHWIVVHYSG